VQLIKHLLLSLTGIRWLGVIKPLAGLAGLAVGPGADQRLLHHAPAVVKGTGGA